MSGVVHQARYRVYYEDTDAGGVVYNANYLKFAERARTDFLREKGINQSELREDTNVVFVLSHVDLRLKAPAKLDDEIVVKTSVKEVKGASVVMFQQLFCRDVLLTEQDVTIVCTNLDLRPVRMPLHIKSIFSAALA